MGNGSIAHIKVKRVRAGNLVDDDDELAVEEPLEIQLSYGNSVEPRQKSISVTMRTPGCDRELAVGFLFTEGIIKNRSQVSDVQPVAFAENKIVVTLVANESPRLQKSERNFYTTSSCGVCGKSSIEAIRTLSVYENGPDEMRVKADLFYGLQAALLGQQDVFESTGGLHASALFDLDGNFVMLREDVGRHNALDKVIGAAFLDDRLPLDKEILLLSGRASFELVQKAAMAGIKIVVSVGAPSSLAMQLAQESGITLIGFLRNERFNIYSGDQRVVI